MLLFILNNKQMKQELIKLLQEVPADTIVFRTANNDTYTAAQLITELEQSTELGHSYGSDMLRVCRDFIKRQANKA
jgi:hypothetical protein